MSSKNSKTSEHPHRLLLNLLDKINLKVFLYQILAYIIYGEI